MFLNYILVGCPWSRSLCGRFTPTFQHNLMTKRKRSRENTTYVFHDFCKSLSAPCSIFYAYPELKRAQNHYRFFDYRLAMLFCLAVFAALCFRFIVRYLILDVSVKTECEEVELRREPIPYIHSLGMSLFRKRTVRRTFWERHIPKRGWYWETGRLKCHCGV